jgi:hypothetical protein
MHIPRSSLRYLLIHLLGHRYRYTSRKPTFTDKVKRHNRIRKFIIELDRALTLQDAVYAGGQFFVRGEYVVVFTDETYIHQTHSPSTSWVPETDSSVGKTSSKGKRLVVLNATTMDNFVVTRNEVGYPIPEESLGKEAGRMEPVPTAEWIWEANGKVIDYHKNMDGDGFERWLENRLIPAFEALYPGKKMILVMDNASYHHQHNDEWYPKGLSPKTATKGLNAHVLRKLGVRSIKVNRKGVDVNFEVPEEEPQDYKDHREGIPGARAPTKGAAGTVYARGGAEGPSKEELAKAVILICKRSFPHVLDSKVERVFREKGWKIIWTPPYCPKFQPIELVWGVGKQRAGTLYFRGRDLKTTREHLRRGWYGGKGSGSKQFEPCNVRGCWETALSEMNYWINADLEHNPGKGLTGKLGALIGVEKWTSSAADCCNIDDMDVGDDVDIDDDVGVVAEAIEQQDVQVAAAHLGGADE